MCVFPCRGASWFVLVALFAFVVGCSGGPGGSVTVSGNVTYDEKAVEEGYIAFQPADDKGNSVGGAISHGKYSVSGIVPGKKRVLITGGPKEHMDAPKNMDEMKEKMGKMSGPKGPGGMKAPPGVPPQAGGYAKAPESTIPADADGNNQTVDITGSKEGLNFDLKKPAGKKR